MDKPKITIIVPVYKVEQCLDRCVTSLINQSFKDIEIILVNDGSPDKCPAMCDEYAKEDDRIRVIHKNNGGLSDARNTGIHSAKGDYILFVDSDDYIEADACEKFSNIVSEQSVDIVIGGATMITGSNARRLLPSTSLHNSVLPGTEYLKHELKHNVARMAAWFNLYRREFLQKSNLFFKIGLLHEDEQWTPRVFLAARNVFVSNNCFYNYIIRENSITKTKDFTKNAEHIISTVMELNELYDKLDDKELKSLLKDRLVTLYLFAYRKGNLHRNRNLKYFNKSYLFRNAYSKRNKMKTFIFFISPTFYCWLGRYFN